MHRSLAWSPALLVVLAALLSPGSARAGEPRPRMLVLAAASMKTALDAVGMAWRQQGRDQATFVYGASPALVRQLEQGSPGDLFVTADADWMDAAATRGLVRVDSRRVIAEGTLVLIAPADTKAAFPVGADRDLDLGRLLGAGRLALAEPGSVPAGRYGKAALTHLGLWDQVKDRLATVADVRAALALVARGEAPLGVVYRSDAAAEPKVWVVVTFPAGSHPRIVYPAALTKEAKHPDASEFLAFLTSPAARSIFAAQGFTLPGAP